MIHRRRSFAARPERRRCTCPRGNTIVQRAGVKVAEPTLRDCHSSPAKRHGMSAHQDPPVGRQLARNPNRLSKTPSTHPAKARSPSRQADSGRRHLGAYSLTVRLRVVAVVGVGCALLATIAVAAVAPGARSVSRTRAAAQPASGPYSRLSPPQQREYSAMSLLRLRRPEVTPGLALLVRVGPEE